MENDNNLVCGLPMFENNLNLGAEGTRVSQELNCSICRENKISDFFIFGAQKLYIFKILHARNDSAFFVRNMKLNTKINSKNLVFDRLQALFVWLFGVFTSQI